MTKIDYDFNGMPTRIQFRNGNVTEYVYSAEGVKLKTIHRTIAGGIIVPYGTRHTLNQAETLAVDSITYVGNFEIDGNYCSKYYFANGYIDMGNTGSGTYHYTITDHLGNVRAVVDENGTLKQVNNYFAYGGILNNGDTGADVQTHKYNGKELDRMHGLDMYDYGARNYDAVLGQFNTMDPLCEKYYHISPYAYCGGNPVNRVDVNGDSILVQVGLGFFHYDSQQKAFLKRDNNPYDGNDAFVSQLTGALNSLKGTKTGKDVITSIEKSSKNVLIHQQREGASNYEAKADEALIPSCISGINWKPNEDAAFGGPAFIALGHELAHSYDRFNGITSIPDELNGNESSIPAYEKYTVHIENKLRSEKKLSLRNAYYIKNGHSHPMSNPTYTIWDFLIL